MPQSEPLSFEQFRSMLAELLDLKAEQLTPEAYFVGDLGVDSIRMVEVFLSLRDMGLEVSPEIAWRIQTVGDAYRYYSERSTLSEDGKT
jgi:acyl carrier protein